MDYSYNHSFCAYSVVSQTDENNKIQDSMKDFSLNIKKIQHVKSFNNNAPFHNSKNIPMIQTDETCNKTNESCDSVSNKELFLSREKSRKMLNNKKELSRCSSDKEINKDSLFQPAKPENDLHIYLENETNKDEDSKSLSSDAKHYNKDCQAKIVFAKLSSSKRKLNEYDGNIRKTIIHEKANRKSKYHFENRDFLCIICRRTYLSYSAIYLHLKTRHKVESHKIKDNYGKKINLFFGNNLSSFFKYFILFKSFFLSSYYLNYSKKT